METALLKVLVAYSAAAAGGDEQLQELLQQLLPQQWQEVLAWLCVLQSPAAACLLCRQGCCPRCCAPAGCELGAHQIP